MSLDEFREAGVFWDDDEEPQDMKKRPKRSASKASVGGDKFLGMTAPQRFILAFIILMTTCLASIFILILTGRVVPPGLI
jgi:hypothetical protein